MAEVVVATGRGRVRGRHRDGVAVFAGIPYAAAPDGPRRFAAPVPAPRWDGVRDALGFGPAAPQPAPAPGVPPAWTAADGLDCLRLNVWTPDPGATGLPVLVWVHGGRWTHGAARMPHYDAAVLAGAGLVVVTLDYRLGFEGFGHVPGAPDNRGLRDQLTALAWVRDEITAFGGDPDRVTAAGHSAGAASIAHLLGSPERDGLLRRAIAQSVPGGVVAVEAAAAVTARLAAALGVAPTREALAAVPLERLVAVDAETLVGPDAHGGAYGPVVDGELVTGPPEAALRDGAGRDVDLLCGATTEEVRGILPGLALDRVDPVALAAGFGLDAGAVDTYRRHLPGPGDGEVVAALLSDALVRVPTVRVADAHAGAGGRTWVYDLAWRGPLGAAHGVDVPVLFGDAASRYAARLVGSPPRPGFAALSERLRTAWAAFAADGDPGWPRYEIPGRAVRVWDDEPSVAADPSAATRRVWEAATPS